MRDCNDCAHHSQGLPSAECGPCLNMKECGVSLPNWKAKPVSFAEAFGGTKVTPVFGPRPPDIPLAGVPLGTMATKPTYNMDMAKGGIKNDAGKVRLELLPVRALEEVGKVLTLGAAKYADDNWRKGMSWRRCLGAGIRHTFSFLRGENLDPETGLCHLAHATCCLLFVLTYFLTKTGTDDRASE